MSISVLIGSQISGSPFPLQWSFCKHRVCFKLKFSHLHKSLPADPSFCQCERVACSGAHELLSTDHFLRDNVRAVVRSFDRPLPPQCHSTVLTVFRYQVQHRRPLWLLLRRNISCSRQKSTAYIGDFPEITWNTTGL